MEKEFCTYNQALALKELGFDEPCFGYYEPNGNFGYIESHIIKDIPYLAKNSEWQDLCSAPLYQQAFRWFREKHNLVSDIRSEHLGYYTSIVNRDVMMRIVMKPVNIFETYEEAESACLDKLIEITKNK